MSTFWKFDNPPGKVTEESGYMETFKEANVPEVKAICTGDANRDTLVFLHGFPDDHAMWSEQVKHFESTHRVVCLVWPQSAKERKGTAGFDFPELVEGVRRAIEKNKGKKKVILVGHDWGALLSSLVARCHSSLIDKLALADVAPARAEPDEVPGGWKGRLLLAVYPLVFACAWLCCQIPVIGILLGKILTTLNFLLFGYLVDMGKGGYSSGAREGGTSNPFSPLQCYPYFFITRRILMRRQVPGGGASAVKGLMLTPKQPTWFSYGTKGLKEGVMFHSGKWVEYLKGRPECKVSVYDKSSHWVMLDEPEKFNRELAEFVAN
uniref:AB hydrolase-1 domain-containing protein n=1 Tax=Chromera velia CCMP2878 TaxID=1169474 RepID=A0A0G4I2T9_9ALVE|eukprot:Cvel_10499.t1-p1 / transcript=Cvel_10499.t1 / gene=Cvel_10499 / organism=Chromera_velia_CCMP2878 / gene_product=Epoxide hydrolase 4, putative / transcript_product=Epoxide hydrolase 4, putative / location=Cvel_scaffold634:65491-70051(-) / protein_length=321 / sequence_SO=supercontig / SO=protein_coding / is_pseudo=false